MKRCGRVIWCLRRVLVVTSSSSAGLVSTVCQSFLKEEFAQNLDVVLKKNKVHKTFSGAFKAKLILINSPEQLKQLDNCFKM